MGTVVRQRGKSELLAKLGLQWVHGLGTVVRLEVAIRRVDPEKPLQWVHGLGTVVRAADAARPGIDGAGFNGSTVWEPWLGAQDEGTQIVWPDGFNGSTVWEPWLGFPARLVMSRKS